MNILIIYATYSSSTEATAEFVKQCLESKQSKTKMVLASNAASEDISQYDLILMGSPSWLQNGKQGQPHAFFFDLMDAWKDVSLKGMQFAVFGSGDKTYTYYCGAVDVLQDFIKKQGGTIVIDGYRQENFYIDIGDNQEALQEWVDELHNKISS